MISWRKNLFWIWLSLFLAMAGFAFAYPVMPFFLEDIHGVREPAARDTYVSLFAFAGNLGFLLFSPLWGKMADIYGRKMMMTRANFCSAMLLPLIAWMPTPAMLVLIRFLIGSFAGVASAAMTLVACSTPQRHRGMAMGAVSSAIFSGNLAGMVAGGFCASTFGYTVTFSFCGVLMAVANFISHFLIRERSMPPLAGTKLQLHFRPAMPKFGSIWYLMLLTVFMGYVQQMDGPFVPILVKDVVNSTSQAALRWNSILGGACAAAGIAGGFIIGSWSDRYPGQRVGILICLAGALCLLPQAFCTALPELFGERMAMTFFVSGLSPIMQSWLSLTTRPEDRGAYFGYATSARAVGWLIGGLTGLVITRVFCTRAIFSAGAAALAIMALGIFLTHRKLPFPPPAGRRPAGTGK